MRIALAETGSADVDATAGTSAAALIDSLEVSLEAFVGKARLTIAEVKALKPDSVVALDSGLGSCVELRLNGSVVALGEVVAVGDRLGVRVTEIGKC